MSATPTSDFMSGAEMLDIFPRKDTDDVVKKGST
jgi:hypothetical protein